MIFFTNALSGFKYGIIGSNIETKGVLMMDILEIMKARHSVRQYSGKKIDGGIREALTALVHECNN